MPDLADEIIEAGETTGTVNWTFNSGAEAFDYLAVNETLLLTYTINFSDGESSGSQVVQISIEGTSDNTAPVITQDTDVSETIAETDTTLMTTGEFDVYDEDLENTVSVSEITVATSGVDSDPATPSDSDLIAMLNFGGGPIIDGTAQSGTANWTFNSGSEAFDYLGVGDELVINYTVTLTDDAATPETTTQQISITIVGTNDAPEVAVEGILLETDAALTADGSFDVTDVDTSDVVSISGVAASTGGDDADSSVPDEATLLAMFSASPTTVIDGDSTSGTVNWEFDSGSETFDYLSATEALEITYTVTLTDDNVPAGTTDQTVTLTIEGTNDAPTDILLSDNEVPENVPGATVGTLAAEDLDSSDTHVFQILSLPGTDYSLFQIVGNELRVGPTPLDYETSATRTVTVRATDPSGEFVDTTFVISVIDSTEATLTTGTDTFAPDVAGTQIIGNAQTLNPTDVLDVGDGNDSLVLFGGGTYDLQGMQISGLEELRVVNFINSAVTIQTDTTSAFDEIILGTVGTTSTYLNGTTELGSFSGGDGSDNLYVYADATVGEISLGNGGDNVYLFTSTGEIDGGTGNDFFRIRSTSALGSTTVFDGGANYDRLYIETGGSFDLAGVTLTSIEEIRVQNSGASLNVSDATLSGVQSLYGVNGSVMTTAESSLDLTTFTNVSGLRFESTNATGTTFRVGSVATAFQIYGGAGYDVLDATGISLTSTQRAYIFAQTDVEEIIDDSSATAYTAPPPSPDDFVLTTGVDTVTSSSADSTITGDITTFTLGDSIDAGLGNDRLLLLGGGTFDFSRLSSFSGVEEIQVINPTTSSGTLRAYSGFSVDRLSFDTTARFALDLRGDAYVGTFDAQSSGGFSFHYFYDTSRVDRIETNNASAYFTFYSSSGVGEVIGGTGNTYLRFLSTNSFNPSLDFDGGAGFDRLELYNGTYDLRSVSLTNVNQVYISNATAIVDQTTLSSLPSISTGTGARLQTTDAVTDLTSINLSAVKLFGETPGGNAYIVDSKAEAFQIFGGNGTDIVQATGLSFTAEEVANFFLATEVETLQAANGTFVRPALALDEILLTTAIENLTGTVASETYLGNEFTFSSNDQINAGDGFDTLKLGGSGRYFLYNLFNLERVEIVNPTTLRSDIYMQTAVSLDELVVDTLAYTYTYISSSASVGAVNLGDGQDFVQLRNSADIGVLDAGNGLNRTYLYDSVTLDSYVGGTSSDYLYLWNENALTIGASYDGGGGTFDLIYFYGTGQNYDLTDITLNNFEQLRFQSASVTVTIDDTTLSDVTQIYGTTGSQLVTEAAVLDLSGKTVSNVALASENATGTTFITTNKSVALATVGGIGTDTVELTGGTFTSTERDFVLNAGSVEIVIDASGVYGGSANDLLVGTAAGETLSGGNGDDRLDGAGGIDTLIGGSGADEFILLLGDGADVVTDYLDGTDTFGLSGGLSFGDLVIDDGGTTETTISAGGEVLAVVQGVSDDMFGSEDFFVL
nr:VCBS domain-containing protein [Ruegeria arenilitoris]